jgi:hypothetical protein
MSGRIDLYVAFTGVEGATKACYVVLTQLDALPDSIRSRFNVVDVAHLEHLRRPSFLRGVPTARDTDAEKTVEGHDIITYAESLTNGPIQESMLPPSPPVQKESTEPLSLSDMIAAREQQVSASSDDSKPIN